MNILTPEQVQTRINRSRGCLLGLAIGDAIGTTVEFKPRGTFPLLTDMVGGGPFRLQPGQWTDDTSMALCLAESLIEKGGMDLADQMRRYVAWHDTGYMSATGRCFDIGNTTRDALVRFSYSGNPMAGSTDPHAAGNGCLMRLAPVAIRYQDDATRASFMAEQQAATTHGAEECLAASSLFGSILARLLAGAGKESTLSPAFSIPSIEAIAVGKYLAKTRDQIRGTGYVVDSLEAALWCFHTTNSFKDCVLTAANLGDDADTTAAIAGQLAGAYYGMEAIPVKWLARVYWGDKIRDMADALAMAEVSEVATEAA